MSESMMLTFRNQITIFLKPEHSEIRQVGAIIVRYRLGKDDEV